METGAKPFVNFLEVQGQLEALTARFLEILKTNLLGIYLHGSLAMGCFNSQRSDLDLLILTRRSLTPRLRATVAQALLLVSGSPAPVELSILNRTDLHPWRHPCAYDFHFSESWRGDFQRFLADPAYRWVAPENGDSDLAAHLTVLRARGKVLYGPAISETFPEIPRRDFLESVFGDILSPEFGLVNDIVSPVYLILNVCRTLAYLKTGQILSKAEGGEWTLENIPSQLRHVIEAALTAYQTDGDDQRLASVDLAAFKQWAREALEDKLLIMRKLD